jgi:hypothetical protein
MLFLLGIFAGGNFIEVVLVIDGSISTAFLTVVSYIRR